MRANSLGVDVGTRLADAAGMIRTTILLGALALTASCVDAGDDPDTADVDQAVGGGYWNVCGNSTWAPTVAHLYADNAWNHMQYSICVPWAGSKLLIRYGAVGDNINQVDNYSATLDVSGVQGAMYQFNAEQCNSAPPAGNGDCYGGWNAVRYVYNPAPFTNWVDVDNTYGVNPATGFVAGSEHMNGWVRDLHVCVGLYNGATHVGKWFADDPGDCHIGYGGHEAYVLHGMVLQSSAKGFYWNDWYPGVNMGPNPVAAGRERGTTQYVCRALFTNPSTHLQDWTPGKTIGNGCNIAWGDTEFHLSGGGVQVLNSY
jgi:hypothetical protein